MLMFLYKVSVSVSWDFNLGRSLEIDYRVVYIPVLGRNTYALRRDAVFDVRGEEQIKFATKYTLQLLAECFNVFNHQNYTSINTTGYTFGGSTSGVTTKGYTGEQTYSTQLQYNPSFGTYTNANSNYAYSPRQVQVAVRLSF